MYAGRKAQRCRDFGLKYPPVYMPAKTAGSQNSKATRTQSSKVTKKRHRLVRTIPLLQVKLLFKEGKSYMLPFECNPILLRWHYHSFAFGNNNAILVSTDGFDFYSVLFRNHFNNFTCCCDCIAHANWS